MRPARQLRPGYVLTYPNREKSSSRLMKAIVVAVLVVSVALMLVVTIGGWSKLQGLTALNFAWCVAYVVIAVYVWRWSRGPLPIAAALALLLATATVIAGTGIGGTSWFDRTRSGFAGSQSLFGGAGLSADAIGVLTLVIALLQLLLIVLAMRAFAQRWNVEFEIPGDGRSPLHRPASG